MDYLILLLAGVFGVEVVHFGDGLGGLLPEHFEVDGVFVFQERLDFELHIFYRESNFELEIYI